jgi:4a-hydroxytetrahydrobiopterin dehydratase
VKVKLQGIKFFNEIAEIAEKEKHHPDLHLEKYQFVSVVLWTHSVGGLR